MTGKIHSDPITVLNQVYIEYKDGEVESAHQVGIYDGWVRINDGGTTVWVPAREVGEIRNYR